MIASTVADQHDGYDTVCSVKSENSHLKKKYNCIYKAIKSIACMKYV